LRQAQHIVVAFDVAVVSGKARAAIIGFFQLAALDHRAHRAIKDQDAGAERLRQRIQPVGAGGHGAILGFQPPGLPGPMPGGVWRLKRRDYLMKSQRQRKHATLKAMALPTRIAPESRVRVKNCVSTPSKSLTNTIWFRPAPKMILNM
jgi:hypothetical protein